MAMQLLTHSKRRPMEKSTPTTALLNPIGKTKRTRKNIILSRKPHTLQAQKIRNILRVTQSEDTFTTTFEDLLFENHYRYLDIAFLNHLWDQEWKGLSDIFPSPEETSNTRQKEISTADVAKLLSFYRCLDPGSYLSAVEWFETTTPNLLLT